MGQIIRAKLNLSGILGILVGEVQCCGYMYVYKRIFYIQFECLHIKISMEISMAKGMANLDLRQK